MNQMQQYPDVHSNHMSAATTHAPASAAPPNMPHYAYQPSQPGNLIQPGPQYSTGPPAYPNYYGNGLPSQVPVSTSMSNALVSQPLALPAMSAPVPGSSVPGSQGYPQHTPDQTGQVAPPGMKPRVTATLWEDEGSLCFQVEAKGVCVARREDNHMINGTKLLNVAGMTRGRRDGILKSEKTRHVVKIGPMHLKGVWIPFERALEFANKEKITEALYPLFVHDIGALLYHPSNQTRAGANLPHGMDRNRRPDPMQTNRYLPANPSSQPPSLHHHHSIGGPMGSQPPHLQGHPSAPRPGLDRAQTFPTPPTSASSLIGMQSQPGSYEWNQSNVQNIQGSQPLSIDTGLSNARSVPTTPATTPPGAVQAGMSYPTAQGYENSRPMYSGPPSQPAQYNTQSQPMMAYRQESTYPKQEMAPPARAPVGNEHQDVKPAEGIISHDNQVNHAQEHEQEPEHENEYTHTNSSYNGNRAAYPYNPPAAPGALHGEHLSPEINGSPHQNGSGRATPRTTAPQAGQWTPNYQAPQRQGPSGNLSYVMGDSRPSTNGNAPNDGYQPPQTSQYAGQGYASTNGVSGPLKRGREDEDEQDHYGRPSSQPGDDIDGLKRRKTMNDGPVGGPVGAAAYNRNPNPGLQRSRTVAQPQARR